MSATVLTPKEPGEPIATEAMPAEPKEMAELSEHYDVGSAAEMEAAYPDLRPPETEQALRPDRVDGREVGRLTYKLCGESDGRPTEEVVEVEGIVEEHIEALKQKLELFIQRNYTALTETARKKLVEVMLRLLSSSVRWSAGADCDSAFATGCGLSISPMRCPVELHIEPDGVRVVCGADVSLIMRDTERTSPTILVRANGQPFARHEAVFKVSLPSQSSSDAAVVFPSPLVRFESKSVQVFDATYRAHVPPPSFSPGFRAFLARGGLGNELGKQLAKNSKRFKSAVGLQVAAHDSASVVLPTRNAAFADSVALLKLVNDGRAAYKFWAPNIDGMSALYLLDRCSHDKNGAYDQRLVAALLTEGGVLTKAIPFSGEQLLCLASMAKSSEHIRNALDANKSLQRKITAVSKQVTEGLLLAMGKKGGMPMTEQQGFIPLRAALAVPSVVRGVLAGLVSQGHVCMKWQLQNRHSLLGYMAMLKNLHDEIRKQLPSSFRVEFDTSFRVLFKDLQVVWLQQNWQQIGRYNELHKLFEHNPKNMSATQLQELQLLEQYKSQFKLLFNEVYSNTTFTDVLVGQEVKTLDGAYAVAKAQLDAAGASSAKSTEAPASVVVVTAATVEPPRPN